MARQLRLDFAGGVHHVTTRGNERRPIFRSDADRRMFLQLLGVATKRFHWIVAAYVLMTNHFHLLIETPEANLSRGMQWLAGAYAMWFNRRHGRSRHLFQGRFHSFLIDRDEYFAEVLRYVVLNPVRAKMVAHPGEYRWSSYRATAGSEAAPEWLDTSAALAPFETSHGSAEIGEAHWGHTFEIRFYRCGSTHGSSDRLKSPRFRAPVRRAVYAEKISSVLQRCRGNLGAWPDSFVSISPAPFITSPPVVTNAAPFSAATQTVACSFSSSAWPQNASTGASLLTS
jgi:REP element-mobilizing transposase RayT